MKITDKIVTSVTQPQQTNVLWHNPETGELKMFGNKGWEVVGGVPGEGPGGGGSSNTNTNGYPVVTVEDNFNITAEPNTFYNIKNDAESDVSINFNPEEFYNTGSDKILLFTFDDVNDINSLFLDVSEHIGIAFKKDTSKEGYKYKSVIDVSSQGYGTVIIYAKSYPTSGEDLEVCISNDVAGLDNVEMTLTNVVIFNEHIDSIIQLNMFGTQIHALCINEVENDSVKFKHKYYGYVAGNHTYIYTLEPYPTCSTIYVNIFDGGEPDYENAIDVKIFKNPINISEYINEFVFNINSPANIISNQTIKWHNDNIPDLTEEGVYTISIVNGVGCYTFVNN